MADINRTPNPPNSPIEKLITQDPLETIRDFIRGKLSDGPVTNEELIDIMTFYDERVKYEFNKQNRVIEHWANIHTHNNVVDSTDFVMGVSPTIVGSYSWKSSAVGITYVDLANIVAGQYVGLAAYPDDRFVVADISDPTNPFEADFDNTSLPNNPQTVDVFGDYAVVVAEGNDVIYLYDVSTPSVISLVDTYAVTSVNACVFLDSSHIAYRGYNGTNHVLVTVGWSSLGFGAVVGSNTVSPVDTRDMTLSPSGLLVAWQDRASYDGVYIGSVSNKSTPGEVGSYIDSTRLNDCRRVKWASNSIILATGMDITTGGFCSIDVTDPTAPTLIGHNGVNEAYGLAVINSQYAAVGGQGGTISIIDYATTPSAPSVFATIVDATLLDRPSAIVFDGVRYATVMGSEYLVIIDLTT